MRVAVTGGSGRIGRHVVAELLGAGHAVTSLDLLPSVTSGARAMRVDLTDVGDVYGALARCRAEAVVHMGAWADAGIVPDTRTYGDNVRGTFNVFQACADLGIRRVVSASSAQVYGFAAAPPVYVPVDEEHPLRPANCYALAKIAGEQAADYFVNTRGLTILSFRLMGIRLPEDLAAQIDALVERPELGGGLLWTRTDARDAALACRLALEASEVAPGPYNITGARVVLEIPSEELVSRYFDARTERRATLSGTQSPMSCARAEAAFGYRPRYVWTVTQRHPTG